MNHRNLVLFESHRICSEAVIFAREYCLRMGKGAALLMLIPMTAVSASEGRRTIQEVELKATAILKGVTVTLSTSNVDVIESVHIGTPKVELLKYLADEPPFNIVIWGSDKALPHHTPFGRHHWMSEIAGNLECPLYSVSNRQSSKQDQS